MSEEKVKDIHKQAFNEAELEFQKKRVSEVKDLVLKVLEKLEANKQKKARIEEEGRILKLDLEDLRKGNFERVIERQEKSKVAKEISVHIPDNFFHVTTTNNNGTWISSTPTFSNNAYSVISTSTGNITNLNSSNEVWMTLTAGAYKVGDKTIYF